MEKSRRADEGDDAARARLHEECFGYPPPRGLFAWKYRDNPHGDAIELVVCGARDELIAAYALVPRRVLVAGAELLAFQASDAMTAEHARGRGLFTCLQAAALEAARARGAAFLFAFSGRGSAQHFERAGYFEIDRYEEYAWQRRWWRWRSRPVEPWIAGETLPPDADAPAVSCVRDASYLGWRVRRTPTGRHGLVHRAERGWWAVVECGSSAVCLADLGPPAAWRESSEPWFSLRAFLGARGCSELRLSLFHGEDCIAPARAAGFRPRRSGSDLPFHVRPVEVSKDELRAAFAQGAWFRDLDRDAEGLLLREAMSGDD